MAYTVHLLGIQAGVAKEQAGKGLEAAIGVDAETARTLIEAAPFALERGIEEKRARELERSIIAAGVRVRVEESPDDAGPAGGARPPIDSTGFAMRGGDTELELKLEDVEALLGGTHVDLERKIDPAPRIILGTPTSPPRSRASGAVVHEEPLLLALFCPRCGAAQDAGGQACHHCGVRLSLGRTSAARTSIAPPLSEAGPGTKQLVVWGVLTLGLLAGLGVLVQVFAP